MKSMTGYGGFEKVAQGYRISVEIKTLNSRFLEFKLRAGSDFSILEPRLLKLIKQKFSRGYVEMSVRRERVAVSETELPTLDEQVIKSYLSSSRKLQKKYKLPGHLEISDLISLPNIWQQKKQSLSSENLYQILVSILRPCLKKVQSMRDIEGKALKKNILSLIQQLEQVVNKVEKKTKTLGKEYEVKLKERLSKLMESESLDEKRLHQEVAFLVSKSDVSEEIVRLSSHFKQYRDFAQRSGPVGKNLEFLTQEMHREINTIGSKIQNTAITPQVVACKSLLEKIKEQVQNVE